MGTAITFTGFFTVRHAKKLNKNLAIANRSRVSCAHNTSRVSRLRVTQGHWTRNHWINHILLVELFEVEYYRDLEM